MNNTRFINWSVVEIDLDSNSDNRDFPDLKVLPTLNDCLSVFYPDRQFSGQFHLDIVEINISELTEISGHKIVSKEDIFEAAKKAGYSFFPNGFALAFCRQQKELIKNRLNKNEHYHVLVKPFRYLYSDGATLSLLRDSDDSLCLSANSGFPSAIEPDSVWLMVKSLEVKQMDGILTRNKKLVTV
ncbi:MAG: hypothetical protein R3B60_01450 [Candidatus Paceibacterota bacterium]